MSTLMLVAYVMVTLVAWIALVPVIAEDLDVRDSTEKAVSVLIAGCLAWLWPLGIPGLFVYRFWFTSDEKERETHDA